MRERNIVKVGAAVAMFVIAAAASAQSPAEIAPPPQATPPPGYKNVYRLAGATMTDHLYTSDANEVRQLTQSGAYQVDGVGFNVLDREYKDSVPLYRFSTPAGRHFLHTDRAGGGIEGAKNEGPIGYVDPKPRPGTVPLYAWADPATGDCFYTTNRTGEQAPQMGMQYRGIVCYVGPT